MTTETPVLICGGGIIGLTIAKALLKRGYEKITILEKEKSLGAHASGRNRGVLHAGIYYNTDSLKAQFCVKGNLQMRNYCKKHHLPLCETGKVVVAKDESELPVLHELFKRGEANGAKVELIDEKQLKEIEPYAKTHKTALYSRNTAVTDPKQVLECLRHELIASHKVAILFQTAFLGLKTQTCAHTTSGNISFHTFINAAGAYSDKVAQAFGVESHYKLIPFKGTYKTLSPSKSHLINGNIYPVPNIRNPFLGVHLTKGIDGQVYVGPTSIPAFSRENYGLFKGLTREAFEILYREGVLFFKNDKFRRLALDEVRKYRASHFFRGVKALVKEIAPEDLEDSKKVGIRPQLVDWKKKELVMDFLVEKKENSIHILNSISPAFTCSMPFAEHVVDNYLPSAVCC